MLKTVIRNEKEELHYETEGKRGINGMFRSFR